MQVDRCVSDVVLWARQGERCTVFNACCHGASLDCAGNPASTALQVKPSDDKSCNKFSCHPTSRDRIWFGCKKVNRAKIPVTVFSRGVIM